MTPIRFRFRALLGLLAACLLTALLCGPAAAKEPVSGLAHEDAMVYNTFWQQQVYAERCIQACPALADKLRQAQQAFTDLFGPAIKAVEPLQTDPGESLKQLRRRKRRRWERDADQLDFACPPCNHTLALIRARTDGRAHSPLREALLRNHPDYARRPELMLEDGFVKRLVHRDPDTGLELILPYPASWREVPAPAGGSAAYSDNGRGFERLMVFSAPHPVTAQSRAGKPKSRRILEAVAAELMAERWCGTDNGCPAGVMHIDGRRARWFVQKLDKPSGYAQQTLWVYTLASGRLIGMQMDVRSASPAESPGEVQRRFQRLLPLFLEIAGEAEFLDAENASLDAAN